MLEYIIAYTFIYQDFAMLKKFTVSNYRQFNEPLEFDLTASNYAFNTDCTHNGLVKLALIYGENGTGKSNLALAMFDIVSHLTDKMFDYTNSIGYLNLLSIEKYATFKYDFEFDIEHHGIQKVSYEYQKDNDEKLLSEKFLINNEVIINYQLGQPFISQLIGTEHLNKNINPQQNLSVIKYIFSNTNLVEDNVNNIIFVKFINFINHILCFRNVALSDSGYLGYKSGYHNIQKSLIKENKVSELEKFLNELGLNYKLCVKNKEIIAFNINNKSLPFFANASTGTVTLAYFYYWWQDIQQNKIPLLFIDEFDCSYHFALSKNIVKKLKELPNTQVILTTHNTDLLSNHLIRPDCGYVIDGKSIKSLNNATNRELREVHNLEKMYQAGEFDNDF